LREYATLTLLSGMGADHEASIALGLLTTAVTIVSAIPGGIIYMFFKEKAEIRKMAVLESSFS
jgi:hypothetical protein